MEFSANDIRKLVQEAIDLAVESKAFYCPFSLSSFDDLIDTLKDIKEEQKNEVLCRLGRTLALSINKAKQKNARMCA